MSLPKELEKWIGYNTNDDNYTIMFIHLSPDCPKGYSFSRGTKEALIREYNIEELELDGDPKTQESLLPITPRDDSLLTYNELTDDEKDTSIPKWVYEKWSEDK